jgi:hypothetical protein
MSTRRFFLFIAQFSVLIWDRSRKTITGKALIKYLLPCDQQNAAQVNKNGSDALADYLEDSFLKCKIV